MKMIRLLSFLLLLGLAGSSGAARAQAFVPAAAPLTAACYLGGGVGGIAGMVTAADTGLPIAHVNVNVSTIYGNTVRSGSTDSAGRYQIAGLAAGSYLIEFDPRYTGQPYLLEWYDNQRSGATATPVVVHDLAVTVGIDAALEHGAQISGRVTAADTGAPLSNASIAVYDSAGNSVAFASTGASGVYVTTPGLPNGSYKVRFRAPTGQPYLDQYYNNKPDLESADAVTLTTPTVLTGIDAALARGAQIAGRVTAADTGAGLFNVIVTIYDRTGTNIATTYTTGGGFYTTTVGLASGSYRLRFAPSSYFATEYIAEYYNDKADLATADPVVVVAPGMLSGIDAALEKGARIAGTITTAGDGMPLSYAQVDMYNATGNQVASTLTNAAGVYTTPGLPTGSYTLGFRHAGYLAEYYNDRPDRVTAQPLTVTAPAVLSGIDAALAKGGAIAGRVTAADGGAGLSDVQVQVYNSSEEAVASAYTDATGAYTLPSELPSGSYRVQFAPAETGPACAYAGEYYAGKLTLAAADVVVVAAPNVTPGINAVLEPGGLIAGKVTAADGGAGLPDVSVQVYDSAGERVAEASTSPAGIYRIVPALRGGSYRLGFFPNHRSSAYSSEYYHNRATLATADTIAISPSTLTSGVDAALEHGGAIAGRVTAAESGAALRDVSVQVYDDGGKAVAYGRTDATGAYTTTPGLRSGRYRVGFFPASDIGPYLSEYYDNSPTLASAGTVVVGAPGVKSGIDAALAKGSRISGRVTAIGSGMGLPDVQVQVYDGQGEQVAYGRTNAAGIYTTGAVPSGSYRARFSPSGVSAGYAGQYYRGKFSLAAADRIAVSAPTPVTGIDAALAQGSHISGRVTSADDGMGLWDVEVRVYNGSGEIVATGYTSTVGNYTTEPGLPSGSYRVEFFSSSFGLLGQYIPEYYDGKARLTTADAVAITAPAQRSGIDGVLARGAQIAGRVMLPGAAPSAQGLERVRVAVYDSSGEQVASGTTNGLGIYRTYPGLRTGNYRVGFEPPAGSGYGSGFYKGKPDLASADPVHVTAPALRAGIDDAVFYQRYLPAVRR